MAKTSVGEYIIDRLHEWGVRRIYGYPGDGINGITAGLRHHGGIEFVQVRHEETAGFCATAHAKYGGGGGPRGALPPPRPRAVHLPNGPYHAQLRPPPPLPLLGPPPPAATGAD